MKAEAATCLFLAATLALIALPVASAGQEPDAAVASTVSAGNTLGVGPLVYDSHTVDDDNNENSSGNGDGIVNPGESIELNVSLRNRGTVDALATYACISTSSPYVDLPYNTCSDYPVIPGGDIAENLNVFELAVSPCVPRGHVIHIDLGITAVEGGPWTDSFDLPVVRSSQAAHVALISDWIELQSITPILTSMGLTYDLFSDNWNGTQEQGIYTSDVEFLRNYCVVVWYASGSGLGRLITTEESSALEQYLQSGGRLLATGYDTLGDPDDPQMADLVRSSSHGNGPSTYAYTISDGNNPITAGPYGWFPAGSALSTGHDDHDQAEADTGQGAKTVAELEGGRDKIIATELPSGGIVVYWNGNLHASDWTAPARFQPERKPKEFLPRPSDPSEVSERMFIVEGVPGDTSPPEPRPGPGEDLRVAAPLPRMTTTIDSDDDPQPCALQNTVALRDEYSSKVAYDWDGTFPGNDILTLAPTLQPLPVAASGIARVAISSPAPVFVMDGLVYATEAADPNEALLKNTLYWLSKQRRVFLPLIIRNY